MKSSQLQDNFSNVFDLMIMNTVHLVADRHNDVKILILLRSSNLKGFYGTLSGNERTCEQ